MELTVISKNELIRWCEFMDIETGLTIDDDVENESVEYLKLEVERLQKLVWKSLPPPPQQLQQQTPAPVVNEEKVNIRTTDKSIIFSLGLMAWMLAERRSDMKRGSIPNKKKLKKKFKKPHHN